MFDKSEGLKIIDFGLASIFDLPAQPRTKRVVTVWYRAPELFFGQKDYSAPVDIWSVGCIFAEMVQSYPLFKCDHEKCQGHEDCEIGTLDCILRKMGTPDEKMWPGVS
jgi:serine/threonine protein kinase